MRACVRADGDRRVCVGFVVLEDPNAGREEAGIGRSKLFHPNKTEEAQKPRALGNSETQKHWEELTEHQT